MEALFKDLICEAKTRKEKRRKREYYKMKKNCGEGQKKLMKGRWKSKGLNMNNFDEVYDRYMNAKNCEVCRCILMVGKKNNTNRKTLNFDKITGEFINVRCVLCTVKANPFQISDYDDS